MLSIFHAMGSWKTLHVGCQPSKWKIKVKRKLLKIWKVIWWSIKNWKAFATYCFRRMFYSPSSKVSTLLPLTRKAIKHSRMNFNAVQIFSQHWTNFQIASELSDLFLFHFKFAERDGNRSSFYYQRDWKKETFFHCLELTIIVSMET